MNVKKTWTQMTKTYEVETPLDLTMSEFNLKLQEFLNDLNQDLVTYEGVDEKGKWKLALDEDPEVENPYRMWRGMFTFTLERNVY
jgi:hypothetical protein